MSISEDEVNLEGGLTRMEVAYGSGDGDEEASAKVASHDASMG